MSISKQKQHEINARKLERQCKFIENAQRVYANKEGNRLNRLYAKEFRAYKKMRALPDLIKKKDNKNAILDRLDKLVWYTYYRGKDNSTEVRAMKAYVKKQIGETPREERTAGERPILTKEWLLEYLCYDPEEGSFKLDSGMEEGKLATCIAHAKRKVPRKDRRDGRTLHPKHYVPYHKGFYLISQEAYLTTYETELGEHNKKARLQNLPPYKVKEKDFTVYKRCYYIRVPKGEHSTLAAKRVDYYLKQYSPIMTIALPDTITNTHYTATHLAYLYMGAGGNWDYSKGIDNAVRVNTDCAPHGLKYYSRKTNKPIRIPCRDGNRLNLKWDNIKPYEAGDPQYISLAQITHAPLADRKPRAPKPISRQTYSYTMNIKEIFVQTAPTTPCYALHNMGKPQYFNYDYNLVKEEFIRRLNALPGHKQLLRNGNVMVTTPAKT